MDRLDGVGVTSLESSVTLNDRKNIVVTGVKKIESFNDKEFLMDTTLGPISIKGNDLEIIKLDTYQGNVSIKGYVNSFTYKEDGKKQKEESMLSKLFR
ncbi:MAG: sporulation protein YabP [Bacilli bacterium]|nr:sporulation protein YabP [Bacilli bacterium]